MLSYTKPKGIWPSLAHKHRTRGTRQTHHLGIFWTARGKTEKWKSWETSSERLPPSFCEPSRSCSLYKKAALFATPTTILPAFLIRNTLKHCWGTDSWPPSVTGPLQFKDLTDSPECSVTGLIFLCSVMLNLVWNRVLTPRVVFICYMFCHMK